MAAVVWTGEWDDQLPDYGTLVLREYWSGDRSQVSLPEGLWPPLDSDSTEDTVNGVLGLTGLGWFHGGLRADASPHVRLELWDGPPQPDSGAWAADADLVADLPYWSPTGTLRSDTLIPSGGGPEFSLSGPGGYQVRAWARPAGQESAETWLLQTWPVPGPPDPPRWWRRDWRRPGAADPGWTRYLGFEAYGVLSAVQMLTGSAAGVPVDELAEWFDRFPEDSFDRPMWTEDEATRARAAGFARELGVPVPRNRRELLDFLVVVGMLARTDGTTGPHYRLRADPPRADRVVTLPPEESAILDRAEAERVHGDLARDIRAAVVWSPYRLLETGIDELAGRLLVSPAAVRVALALLDGLGRVAVHGAPGEGVVLAAEVPDPMRDYPHDRAQHEALRAAAGLPPDPVPDDPAPHLRPRTV